jgi:peptidoglycan/LPS O-acetylase OafA/YrhL
MSIGLRNKRIDLIRAVSIMLVLLHHFNIVYRLSDTSLARLFGWEAVQAVVRNGNYGVTMFFVISGFLITSNAYNRWVDLGKLNARAFYNLRAARILPCLLLLLLIVDLLAFSGVSVFRNHAQSGGSPPSLWLANLAGLTFWMNVLIVHVGWFNYPLGVLWSLSVEEVFYVSFPIICLLLRRERLLVIFWAAIIIAGPICRIMYQGSGDDFLYAYFACFDGIAIGCSVALLSRRVALHGRTAQSLQIPVIAGMVTLYLYRPISQSNVLGVTLIALGTAFLLLAAGEHRSGPLLDRSRALAILGWFGRFSYELYLFHLVVLGAMRTIVPARTVTGDEKLVLLIVFLALSAAVSALIGYFWAAPLNRTIRCRLAADRFATGIA